LKNPPYTIIGSNIFVEKIREIKRQEKRDNRTRQTSVSCCLTSRNTMSISISRSLDEDLQIDNDFRYLAINIHPYLSLFQTVVRSQNLHSRLVIAFCLRYEGILCFVVVSIFARFITGRRPAGRIATFLTNFVSFLPAIGRQPFSF
jgi:hypothetical protein